MSEAPTQSAPSTRSALDSQSGLLQVPGARVLKLLGWRSRIAVTLAYTLLSYGVLIGLGFPLLFLLSRLPFDVPAWIDFASSALGLWLFVQVGFLVYARLFRRALARRFPDGRIPPTCLRCGYSLAGLPDDHGWRVCPECNHKSPDRIRIKMGRMLSVFWWPQIRERAD